MKKQIQLTIFSLLLAFVLTSCPEVNNPKDATDKIKTGERQDLPSKSVGTAGGTITFGDEAKELKGLKIDIPANSYDISKTFVVSYANIESHKFGERFKPISPLIKISNGGGYSERVMTIEIPAEVSEGAIATAFFFNDKTGDLEPIPVIRYSKGKVVVATRHLMSNGLMHSKAGKKTQPEILVDELYSHIVLSEVKEADLIKAGLLSSGFEPGKDDWEFTNWGSIITPDGNCSGHSLTSLWYFSVQKKITNKGLYHYFDKFDKDTKPDPFWQDNAKGMKFVSMVQFTQDKYWGKIWSDFYSSVRAHYSDQPHFFDAYSREGIKSAAAQIYVTNEPVHTIVSTDETGSSSHAIVCYSVDYASGKVYVADPNFPGSKSRIIEFADGAFKPYISGDNANAPNNTVYKYFAFFGKSALYNWESIAYHWDETISSNIGKNTFPKVTYTTLDDEGKEIELPEIILYSKNYPLIIKCDITNTNVTINESYISLYKIDNKLGLIELARTNKGKLEIEYYFDESDKNSDFGIWVWNLAQNDYQNWIDFKWIKVTDLRIEPQKMNGEKNKEYTWKAIIQNPPSNARYEWNFGDKSPIVKVKNNPEVKHTYKEDGVFPIILELYDDSKNQLFAVATGYAVIGAGLIDTTYILEFPGYGLADKKPTFEVTIKGVVSANDLQLKTKLTFYSHPFYVYQCKTPTDLNVELTISIKYISGKITEKTGFYYGLYQSEYEFEVLNKGFATLTDTSNTFKKMTNYRCDTTGNIFRLKGTMNQVPENPIASLILQFYNKRKSLEYYRENDGTEYTKEEYDEYKDMFFGFTMVFNK